MTKKRRELKEKQAEIAVRIEQHQQGEGEYRATLESLISLASRAAELFERSKTDQKRQLIAFVFSNLQLRGKKLEFSLRSPFDLMVDRQFEPSDLNKFSLCGRLCWPSRRTARRFCNGRGGTKIAPRAPYANQRYLDCCDAHPTPRWVIRVKVTEAVRLCTPATPPKADVNSPPWLPLLSIA